MNDKISLWDANPVTQFAAFIASPAFVATGRGKDDLTDEDILSDGSAAVYLAMFNKFQRWAGAKNLVFSALTSDHLLAYLDDSGRDLNSAIATRYLRLLDRCFRHLDVTPNPAMRANFAIHKSGAEKFDRATVVLTDTQFQAFLAALPVHGAKYPRGGLKNGWKRRRDRAMQVTMLCAGARVAEVIGLLLEEVPRQPELDGTLRISISPEGKHETSYPHDKYLRTEAVPELLGWLDERRSLPIPGRLVFPANERGDPLSKATVYRQVAGTFERAGIAIGRSGGRTLRNTYAVQDLRNGISIVDVAERLGLADQWSAETYRKASEIE